MSEYVGKTFRRIYVAGTSQKTQGCRVEVTSEDIRRHHRFDPLHALLLCLMY
jgi:hypothetical protein